MNITVSELITRASVALKQVDGMKPPEWAAYVKTGMHKERPPLLEDWWYNRSAAVLCAVRRLGQVGVEKLRTKYGGKKNRGVKRGHHFKGSGNIIRTALQQLEGAGFIEQNKEGRKGRVITGKGQSFLAGLVKDESGRTKAKKTGGASSKATSGAAVLAAGDNSKKQDE